MKELYLALLNFLLKILPFQHRVAKNTAAASKNVINISKTISERQQMRSVSVFYDGMFNFSVFELPEIVFSKHEITEESQFHSDLKDAMGIEDLVCASITVNNQFYKNGDIVVVGIEDSDNLVVGLIKSVLVKDTKVFFVIQRYTASRHWLGYFTCRKPGDDICEFVESNNIKDFKPLILRGTVQQFMFTLHHHISFDYQ